MLIFLYGPDNFRSRQKLNEIVEHYKEVHKSGLNFKIFDCETSDFQDFKNELNANSIFKEKKLIVLKNVFTNPTFEEAFFDYKENLLEEKEGIIVFFQEEISSKRNKTANSSKPFFKFLKENAKSQEFKIISGQQLRNWINKEVGRCGVKISQEAANKIILYCGEDLWQIFNEIRKLAAYKIKDREPEITPQDIAKLVKAEVGTDIFKTIDAISSGNKKQALSLLKEHLVKGELPLYLLSMVNFQFRNILIVKDLIDKRVQYQLIVKKSGLHPFVVSKSYEICKRFDSLGLKKIYHRIFQADLDIKTGKLEPEMALELLVAGL